MGWFHCGKKSAEINFPFHQDIHIQSVQKDRRNWFYQYVELTFTKIRDEEEEVITRARKKSPEEDETFGREIVREDLDKDDMDTQEPPASAQVSAEVMV
mmetsp:Transcript_1185/g.1178  ORF Transcript_1185/g.1178 Transcript_1185/m.1178 type:complete len:99 (+) Transcript_1185:3-299(+)